MVDLLMDSLRPTRPTYLRSCGTEGARRWFRSTPAGSTSVGPDIGLGSHLSVVAPNVETAALNFTLNRAYVALSRPARRLALICSEYPTLLRKVDKSLFDVTQS